MATPGSMGMGVMGMAPRMMGPGGMAPSMGPFAPSLPPMDPRLMGPFNPPPPMGSSLKNLNNPLNAPEKDNLISGCPLDYLVTMGTTEPQTTVLSDVSFPKKLIITLFGKAKDKDTCTEGIYILCNCGRPVNGKPHWLQENGQNSLWYDKKYSNWKIGSKIYMGSSKCWMYSAHDVFISHGWYFFVDNNAIFTSSEIFITTKPLESQCPITPTQRGCGGQKQKPQPKKTVTTRSSTFKSRSSVLENTKSSNKNVTAVEAKKLNHNDKSIFINSDSDSEPSEKECFSEEQFDNDHDENEQKVEENGCEFDTGIAEQKQMMMQQRMQMAQQANSMGMMRPGQMDMDPGGPNGPMMGQMRPHMNPQMMMQMQSQQQQKHPMQMQGPRPPPPENGKMTNHQPEGYKKYYVCSDNEVDESSEEDKPKNIEQQQIQPSQQQMESARLGPLPPGWEQREINGGEIYFINHHEKKSSWFDPRVPIDSQRVPHRTSQGQNGGQPQNCYNESSEEDKPKNDYKNFLLFDDLQESTSESDSDFSLSNDEAISDISSSESEVEELMEDLKKIWQKK